jgi:hypothetical protein
MLFKSTPALAAAALGCALLAAAGAQASTPVPGPIDDPRGDFLPGYTGPKNADLDVRSAAAFYDKTDITLITRMWGNIGETSNSLYVWGVDRGHGTDFLGDLPGPHIGDGVSFDAFIVLTPDGAGSVHLINDDLSIAPGTDLAAGAVTIKGDTIKVVIPRALLPSNGVDISQYGFNMWPRVIGLSNNAFVSDLAPDGSIFTGSGVPEPAAWALMLAGFGLVGATLRRPRQSMAV